MVGSKYPLVIKKQILMESKGLIKNQKELINN
jgi:hypothetical protein